MLKIKSKFVNFKDRQGEVYSAEDLDLLFNALIIPDIVTFPKNKNRNFGYGFTKEIAAKVYDKITVNKDSRVIIINDISLQMYHKLLSEGFKKENIYLAFGKWTKKAETASDTSIYEVMLDYVKNNFDEDISIITLKELFGMKVDLIIANPPYDKNMHLKITEKILDTFYEDGKEIVTIQPIRWLQDPRADEKASSDYNKFKASIYDRIADLETKSAVEAQVQFNIVSGTDLGFYAFNKNKTRTFSNLLPAVIYKIKNQLTAEPVFDKDKKNGWRARISTILSGGKSGGNGNRTKWHGLGFMGPYFEGMKDGKPWYEFYVKNQYSKTTDTITNSIAFNSENEAKNFINSMQTTFGYYVTYNLIPDVNIRPSTIMWLEDYTQPWSNERLCAHFGITGFISDTEAVPNSEWEEILNTMSKIDIYKSEEE